MLSQIIQRSWYRQFSVVTLILLPLSILFCALAAARSTLYRLGILSQTRLPVPVIVVGNISVGGTGKTPLVVAVTEYLISKGYTPGVVSRGYGGQSNLWPQIVTPESNPAEVGDEAVLIAGRCRCPIGVGPDRVKAAETLLQNHQCNIIISDDGLQHLALQRDIEIVVIDGERRFGNGLCLPAGPLRELASRLNRVDMVVSNGQARVNELEMQLAGNMFLNVREPGFIMSGAQLAEKDVHAVSGIGNNERFFESLEGMGLKIKRHSFPDHFAYTEKDIEYTDDLPIVMTEKDAVKCQQFAGNNVWFLKVDAKLKDEFYTKLDRLLENLNL
jgi:tetraacyldisaccharide 4'-kinase